MTVYQGQTTLIHHAKVLNTDKKRWVNLNANGTKCQKQFEGGLNLNGIGVSLDLLPIFITFRSQVTHICAP